MNLWKTPLFALTLTAMISTTAQAEQSSAAEHASDRAKAALMDNKGKGADHSAVMGKSDDNDGPDILDDETYEKIQKMKPEDRRAFFEKRRAEYKNMTPEQRQALREKRKAWFNSLPPEKQQQLKDRRAKHRDEMKERWKNMTPEQKAEMKKKREERFNALPPEEQAKIKARHEERKQERKEHWEKMSDEEKSSLKEKRRANHPQGNAYGHDKERGPFSGKDRKEK